MPSLIDYGDDADKPKKKTEPEEAALVSLAGERSKGPQSIQRAAKKSADPLAMLQAVTEAHTPEEMTRLLRRAAEIAVDQKSWMGIVEILRLELEYAVGKPVQRSVSASLDPEEFAKHFLDD